MKFQNRTTSWGLNVLMYELVGVGAGETDGMDVSTPGKPLPFYLTLEGSFDLQFQHLSGKVIPGGLYFQP